MSERSERLAVSEASLPDRSCGSERSERLTASEASLGGGMGQGWWLEVGRARVGAILVTDEQA